MTEQMTPDVLAVLRDYCAQHGGPEDFGDAIDKLSELIAADVEYDEAKKKNEEAKEAWSNRHFCRNLLALCLKVNAAEQRFDDAVKRRAAALAACRGL